MRRDVLDLRAFYASPLGQAARAMLQAKIGEAWGGCANLDVLGLGYATPFLNEALAKARRTIAVSLAAQGVEVAPEARARFSFAASSAAPAGAGSGAAASGGAPASARQPALPWMTPASPASPSAAAAAAAAGGPPRVRDRV
jgi:hypothetical protein